MLAEMSLAVFVAFLLAMAACASTECSGDVVVGGYDDFPDWGASLDVGPDGTAWVAWMESDPEELDEEIYFARSIPSGWTEPEKLHGENVVADRFPDLSVGDDGVVWVVWYKYSYTGARLYVTHGGAGGWSAPEPVHPGAGRYDDKTIFAVDSTDVWMATATSVAGVEDNVIVIYHWQGTEWDGPWQVVVPGHDCDYPDFGMDDTGRMWLVWRAKNTDALAASIMAGTWTGEEWTDYQTVSGDSSSCGDPQIVFDGDVPMVTWTGDCNTAASNVRSSRLEDGAWTPSALVNLPDSSADWDYNRSCTRNSDGTIAAVWWGGNSYDALSPSIYMSWWTGHTWTPEKKVNDDGEYTTDRYPSGALDDLGTLWVAWQGSGVEYGPDTILASSCAMTSPVSFGPATAEAQDDSVLVRWLASGEAAAGPFAVWKDIQPEGDEAASVPPPDAVALNKDPITGPPYEWVDDDPAPGRVNSYWVSWEAPGGTRYAGPSSVFVGSGSGNTLPARVMFVRPNPSRTGGCFRIEQRDAGSAEVTLYTVGGRAVRRLASDSRAGSAGRGSEFDVCWDGKDDSGERVSSGAYVWELRFNGARVADQKGIVTVVR